MGWQLCLGLPKSWVLGLCLDSGRTLWSKDLWACIRIRIGLEQEGISYSMRFSLMGD